MAIAAEPTALGSNARVFRLGGEFRRCGVYCLVGSVVIALAGVWIRQQFVLPNPPPIAILVFLPVAAVGLFLFTTTWRLHVDGTGIARRRFWVCDLWPWEAFHDGRAFRGKRRDDFKMPSKAWWQRTLTLDYLSEADREYVSSLSRALCPVPSPPSPPSELIVRYPFR